MQLDIAIRHRIKNLLKENKMKPYNLSIGAGVHPSTLNYFLEGKTDIPNLSTLLHYCEALDIELWEFFKDPVFKDVKHE